MTSGGQSYNLYLNVVHFFNTSVNKTSVADKDSCFPTLVLNTHCSIIEPDIEVQSQLMVSRVYFFLARARALSASSLKLSCSLSGCPSGARAGVRTTSSLKYHSLSLLDKLILLYVLVSNAFNTFKGE